MRRLLAAAGIAAVTFLAVGPAAAAPPGKDGAFNFRLGFFFPSGGGDFWRTNEDYYTLDHSDFNGLIGGVGYNAAINNYFEFDLNGDFYASWNRSADSYFVDQDGFSIFHDTRLAIYPLTAGFRVLPGGRFARRGTDGTHYVRRPVPYIGAGIGLFYWQYEEEGDFVASDLSIVYDRLVDSGLSFGEYVTLGIEFPVAPQWNITLEVRQTWAEASPGGAFAGINDGDLDLGGTAVYVGGALRF